MAPKYLHYNLKWKSVIKPYDGLLSAYDIRKYFFSIYNDSFESEEHFDE